MTEQLGWLIESENKDGVPIYFHLTPGIYEEWTTDSIVALRFARREDADHFANSYLDGGSQPCRVVEHMWCDTQSSPAPEAPARQAKADLASTAVLLEDASRLIATLTSALRNAQHLIEFWQHYSEMPGNEFSDHYALSYKDACKRVVELRGEVKELIRAALAQAEGRKG